MTSKETAIAFLQTCAMDSPKAAMEIAVVHMLRFENGKISEMWDVGQVMDKNSPNKNGMF